MYKDDVVGEGSHLQQSCVHLGACSRAARGCGTTLKRFLGSVAGGITTGLVYPPLLRRPGFDSRSATELLGGLSLLLPREVFKEADKNRRSVCAQTLSGSSGASAWQCGEGKCADVGVPATIHMLQQWKYQIPCSCLFLVTTTPS